MARSLDAGAFAQHYCSYETDDKARIGERKLVNTLKDDEKFEDPQFKADGTSLYYDPLHPPVYGIPPDVVNWPRLSEVGSIKGLIEPVSINEVNGGMVQGALRDRWFLCALGLLNTVDKVKRVLVSSECADKGIYTVKFFKSGRWRYVHVDDRIPCGRNGTPHFARSINTNEVWVMVVEKAYAKLHGCYEALAGGTLDEAMEDVTGRAIERIAMPSSSETLWNDLIDAISREGLVGVCRSVGPRRSGDPLNADYLEPDGLVNAHMYTVLEIKHCEADATVEYDYMEKHMVKLTTPWRFGKWKGRWCEGHALWNEYEPIAEQCGMKEKLELGEDGLPIIREKDAHEFWMEWSDFVGAFDTLLLSREYEKDGSFMSYRGTWLPGSSDSGTGGPPTDGDWPQNPQYVFDVTEATRFCATLSQEDNRFHKPDPLGREDLFGIGFSIQHVKGGRRAAKFKAPEIVGGTQAFDTKRQVWAACWLEPGSYTLVPATQPPASVATPLVITMFSDKVLNFQNADDEMPDLAPEEEHDAELDAASAALAEKVSSSGVAAAVFPEPTGSELQALWTQTAHLATFMKELKGDCDRLEELIAGLEGADAKGGKK